MAKTNSQTNPLRIAKTREDFEAQRRDRDRDGLGITGTLFAGQEATVVISAETAGWHHMDVEYATLVRKMLGEMIASAKKHNRSLKKPSAGKRA
jgi:predicted NBD/HSP70 family sugar kinase